MSEKEVPTINLVTDPTQLKVLQTPCETIVGMPDPIKEFIEALGATAANTENCAGLSANQIWNDIFIPAPKVFVLIFGNGWVPFINPEVTGKFKKKIKAIEACVSIPDKQVIIERSRHIVASFYDIEGNFITNQHIYNFVARAFMHEYDHLNGKLITDYE